MFTKGSASALTASALAFLFGVTGADRAHSQEVSGFAALGVSTFGPTIQGGVRFTPSLGVRGLYAGGLSGSETEEIEGVPVELDGTLGGLALLGEFYPTQSNWFVAGGIFASNTDVSGSTTDTFTFDTGTTVTGTLSAEATFANEIAPMITTGYRRGFGRNGNWGVAAEIGAIFTGGAEATVVSPDGSIAAPEVAEAQADLDAELPDFNVVPFLAIGVSYHF